MSNNYVLARELWRSESSTWIDDLQGWVHMPGTFSSIHPDYIAWLNFNNLKCQFWPISYGIYKHQMIVSFSRTLTDEELIEFKFRWEHQQ
jgi:hypothetical protein